MNFAEYVVCSILIVIAIAAMMGGIVELFERYVPEDVQEKLVDWFIGRG